MKSSHSRLLLTAAFLAMNALHLQAQGTAFTYQGRLADGASPANGVYDFRFGLFDNASAGVQQGAYATNAATAVSNGLFTVTLDFGSQFPGAGRWLEIGVRTNGTATFVTLTPRQPITPTPYSITAGSALAINTVSNQSVSLAAGGVSVLEITPVFDMVYNSPTVNSRGGYFGNVIASNIVGGFIGGGGNSSEINQVLNYYASVLGGAGNTSSGFTSTAMGFGTTASGNTSTAMGGGTTASGLDSMAMGGGSIASGLASSAMGFFTLAIGNFSTAMGSSTLASGTNSTAIGNKTIASGDYSIALGVSSQASGTNSTAMGDETIASGNTATAMGYGTSASGDYSTAMGEFTQATGVDSTAMGSSTIAAGANSIAAGMFAAANHDNTFVWSDGSTIFRTSNTNQFLIQAKNGVGINTTNPLSALHVNGDIRWGNGSILSVNQTGSIELGNSAGSGTTPFVDFHYGNSSSQDFNVRLINDADGQMDFFNAGSSTPALRITSSGQIGINNNSPTHKLSVTGDIDVSVNIYAGSAVYANGIKLSSDRNLKTDFEPVSQLDLLAKVLELPITTWVFTNSPSERHLGPMAQDFKAAFGLGDDDKHIGVTDENGVALASIQGLNSKLEEKLKEKEDEIDQLKTRESALEERLKLLEQKLQSGDK